MKAVLISIQPRHCENICTVIGEENGKPIYKKTVEVRKKRPKLQTPFKCYIYKSFGKKKDNFSRSIQSYFNCGKVIGEFVCDRIDKYESEFWDGTKDHAMEQIRLSYYADPDDWECEEELDYITGNEVDNPDDCELCKQTCLSYAEIRKYIGTGIKEFYGWHISDLKIYDKPKELGEFTQGYKNTKRYVGVKELTRPPQSWCYVEQLNEVRV